MDAYTIMIITIFVATIFMPSSLSHMLGPRKRRIKHKNKMPIMPQNITFIAKSMISPSFLLFCNLRLHQPVFYFAHYLPACVLGLLHIRGVYGS